MNISLSTLFDSDSQQQLSPLLNRPQSTPISSPILFPRLSTDKTANQDKTDENLLTISKNNKKRRIITIDQSTLTNITPLNDINNQMKSAILLNISSDDEDDNDKRIENCVCPRPPPLMVLSQSIQAKYPEQLNEKKLSDRFSSIKDLPSSPANYSFVFYGFTQTFVANELINFISLFSLFVFLIDKLKNPND